MSKPPGQNDDGNERWRHEEPELNVKLNTWLIWTKQTDWQFVCVTLWAISNILVEEHIRQLLWRGNSRLFLGHAQAVPSFRSTTMTDYVERLFLAGTFMPWTVSHNKFRHSGLESVSLSRVTIILSLHAQSTVQDVRLPETTATACSVQDKCPWKWVTNRWGLAAAAAAAARSAWRRLDTARLASGTLPAGPPTSPAHDVLERARNGCVVTAWPSSRLQHNNMYTMIGTTIHRKTKQEATAHQFQRVNSVHWLKTLFSLELQQHV